MTPPLQPPPTPPAHESLDQYAPIFKLPVERYHELVDAGAFDDAAVELLEGILVQKMSKDPIHSATTGILQDLLLKLLPIDRVLSLGEPITTSDSEAEPDISIVRGKRTDFLQRHPTPAETDLVIEVANSSLSRDQTLKLRVYAAAGCAEYWIVNTTDRIIQVCGSPRGRGYETQRIFRRGDRVAVALKGQAIGHIDLDEVFPEPT